MASHRLSSPWLEFAFDDATGAWSLAARAPGGMALYSAAPAARLVGRGMLLKAGEATPFAESPSQTAQCAAVTTPSGDGDSALPVATPSGDGDSDAAPDSPIASALFPAAVTTPSGDGDSPLPATTPSGDGDSDAAPDSPIASALFPAAVTTPSGDGDSGVGKSLTFTRHHPQTGLLERLTFHLPADRPVLLWRLSVENQGAAPLQLDELELMDARLPAPGPSGWRFFANGWQSWSFAGAYTAGQRMRRTRLGFLRTPLEGSQPQPRGVGRFRSEMFGVVGDLERRQGWLAGFLSQRRQFGYLEARLATTSPVLRLRAACDGLRLEAGQVLHADWACLQLLDLDDADPWQPYLTLAGQVNQVPAALESPAHISSPTGWCSWYQFSSEDYTGALRAEDVRSNLAAVASLQPGLPLQVVQIDDGFERQVGDWLEFSPGFPDGVAGLADEIRAAGFTPGLWLAPFIVHPRSNLAAQHPEWLLRGPSGRPANAGFLWGTITHALDLTHPAALDYVRKVIHTAVHEWGFTYLKLDFLYAGGLPGRHYEPGLTRAQALQRGFQAIRQAAGPDATLLGCGSPLGAALGWVDAMRIGPDTARRWRPSFKGQEFLFEGEFDIPSARNACHNTLTRAPLHRRWWINDPDCLLLRPQTALTLAELQTVASCIALSGGSLLLSDDLPALPPERLALAAALLPPIARRPRLLDWLGPHTPARLRLDLDGPAGAWSLLALFNWDDRPQDLCLRLADFDLHPQAGQAGWLREFWSGQVCALSGEPLQFRAVPPHGVRLAAVRFAPADRPQYLGSGLHISQGLEAAAWQPGADRLLLRLERPGRARGAVDLYLPGEYEAACTNAALLSRQDLGGQVYRFDLDFEGWAELSFVSRQA